MTDLVHILRDEADEAERFNYLNHARRLRSAAAEIERLHALIAKDARNWSTGDDEQFGGRFLCIHGLTRRRSTTSL